MMAWATVSATVLSEAGGTMRSGVGFGIMFAMAWAALIFMSSVIWVLSWRAPLKMPGKTRTLLT